MTIERTWAGPSFLIGNMNIAKEWEERWNQDKEENKGTFRDKEPSDNEATSTSSDVVQQDVLVVTTWWWPPTTAVQNYDLVVPFLGHAAGCPQWEQKLENNRQACETHGQEQQSGVGILLLNTHVLPPEGTRQNEYEEADVVYSKPVGHTAGKTANELHEVLLDVDSPLQRYFWEDSSLFSF